MAIYLYCSYRKRKNAYFAMKKILLTINIMADLINSNGTLNQNNVTILSDNIITQLKRLPGGARGIYDSVDNLIRSSGTDNYSGTDDIIEPSLNFDEKKIINNNFTDITTKELTHDVAKMKLIVNLTYSVFENVLNGYCDLMGIPKDDIIFVYKGGNVLRFIFQESMKEFPGSSSHTIYDSLAQFFKVSDNDYSILINPDIPDYDTIFKNLTGLTYIVLCALRKAITDDLPKLFDYYDKEYPSKKNIIASRFEDIEKDVKRLTGGTIVEISHGNDKFRFDTKDNSQQHATPREYLDVALFNDGNQKDPSPNGTFEFPQLGMTTSNMPFRNSINEIIKFDWENGTGVTRFNLIRTKEIFPAKVQLPGQSTESSFTFSGELIDVSIPYKIHLDKSAIVNYVDNTHELNFKSYDFDHYILDLEFILFDQLIFPWTDIKYNKRLIRVVFLYCYDLLFFSKHNDEGVKSMEDVVNKLKYILDILKSMKKPENKNDLINYAELLQEQFTSDKIAFKRFFGFVARIVRDTKTHGDFEENYVNLLKFVDNLDDNIYKLYLVFSNVQNFISKRGEITPTDLYKQLGGDTSSSLEYGDKLLSSLGY